MVTLPALDLYTDACKGLRSFLLKNGGPGTRILLSVACLTPPSANYITLRLSLGFTRVSKFLRSLQYA
jgi:hypothetical protein